MIEDYVILKNNKKIYLNELAYIKSEDHYLEFYTQSKKEMVRGTISEILEQLPPNFEQSHRSYIINKNYIETKNSSEIVLKNLPILKKNRKLWHKSQLKRKKESKMIMIRKLNNDNGL